MAERDDLREFILETTLRVERATRAISAETRAELRLLREEDREYFEALREQGSEARRRTDELIDEGRAQRQALLSILDRLDDGGSAPAA